MEKIILIKYGELTTKKANRKIFVKMLEQNIRNILKDENVKIISDRVRMYIEGENLDNIAKKLTKVFGLHGIVLCYKVNTNIDEIQNVYYGLAKKDETINSLLDTYRSQELKIKI